MKLAVFYSISSSDVASRTSMLYVNKVGVSLPLSVHSFAEKDKQTKQLKFILANIVSLLGLLYKLTFCLLKYTHMILQMVSEKFRELY